MIIYRQKQDTNDKLNYITKAQIIALMNNSKKLEIAETILVATSVAGSIVSIATQQILYLAAPLTLTLPLNLFNRRRQEENLNFKTAQVKLILAELQKNLPVTPITELKPIEEKIKSLQIDLSTLSDRFTQREEPSLILALEEKITHLSIPTEITHLEQQFQNLQELIINEPRPKNITLPPPKENNQFQEIEEKVTALEQQLMTMSLLFDTRDLEDDLLELKRKFRHLEETQSHLKHNQPSNVDLSQIELQITQLKTQQETQILELQKSLYQLTESINQKNHIINNNPQNEIAQLKQELKLLSQQNTNFRLSQIKPTELPLENLRAVAHEKGIGLQFELLLTLAYQKQLTLQYWPGNLVLSPASHHHKLNLSQSLLIVSVEPSPSNQIQIWISPTAIATHYHHDYHHLIEQIGTEGWRELDFNQLQQLITILNQVIIKKPIN